MSHLTVYILLLAYALGYVTALIISRVIEINRLDITSGRE